MAKKTKFNYDVLVIGSGAGGSVAAHQLAAAGKSVALVEADQVGGECPNIGCVPTKALLHAADIYHTSKSAARFGLRTTTLGYNYPSVRAWKDLAVKRTGTYLGKQIYANAGIDFVAGRAHFIDKQTITVGSQHLSARRFIIATGSRLVVPPIPGLEKAGYLTSTEAINLGRPPRSLAIIGGGAIGCEFATLFGSFGTTIHIIDMAPNLLARDDPEVGQFVAQQLEAKFGASSHLGTAVTKVESVGLKKKLTLEASSTKAVSQLIVDEILLATGKRAAVDLGLDNAGINLEHGMIAVDKYLATSNYRVQAAGDCVGPYQFTHTATYQSKIIAHNLLHPRNKRAVDYRAVPRCIFTKPEVASVGLTETELKAGRTPYRTATAPVAIVGRANANDAREGFVKVLASAKTGQLLGAAIACPHAGEMIHELTLAVQHGLTAQQVAETIHAFPTWSEVIRVACHKLAGQF